MQYDKQFSLRTLSISILCMISPFLFAKPTATQHKINESAVHSDASLQDQHFVTCPPLKFVEQAKTWSGRYYLKGIMETGSTLILNPNGRFDFMLAYGAMDQSAQGQWWLNPTYHCIGLAIDANLPSQYFQFLSENQDQWTKEIFAEAKQIEQQKQNAHVLHVFALEKQYGMSLEGFSIVLRWADGTTEVQSIHQHMAQFTSRKTAPTAIALTFPDMDEALTWVNLPQNQSQPFIIEILLNNIVGQAIMLPQYLEIHQDVLLPVWEGRGQRGEYYRPAAPKSVQDQP
ncbi:MAG: hypothetical protein LKF82_14970 [Acinetobacter populi]|jgi:hypothetical protein|uniref:hypothetical protein n=1 Tax=Acinetobacter populi TaxID=1582270 RepID=UPI0023561898|nr:hypothetical protein [Acinetobacter populi]MCH4249103.1 hypothetical protein [Acinetobacter populi]